MRKTLPEPHPTLALVEKSVDVEAAFEAVWAIIGKFNVLAWHPGIESGTVQFTDNKNIRRLTAKGGNPIFVEELDEIQKGKQKAYVRYRMVSGLPAKSHSLLKVEALGDGKTRVTWCAIIDKVGLDDTTVDNIRTGVGNFYEQGLNALAEKFAEPDFAKLSSEIELWTKLMNEATRLSDLFNVVFDPQSIAGQVKQRLCNSLTRVSTCAESKVVTEVAILKMDCAEARALLLSSVFIPKGVLSELQAIEASIAKIDPQRLVEEPVYAESLVDLSFLIQNSAQWVQEIVMTICRCRYEMTGAYGNFLDTSKAHAELSGSAALDNSSGS